MQRTLAERPASPTARKHLAAVRRALDKQESARQMQGFARIQGVTSLRLGPRHGLSREYTWGPRTWTVEMDAHDVEVLMRLHEAHRQAFRVIPDVIVARTA